MRRAMAVVTLGTVLAVSAGCDVLGGAKATPTPAAATSGGSSAATGTAAAGIPPITGDTQKTASGLQYIDQTVGSGATATAGKNVSVQYTGWLTNGQKFDASRDHGGAFAFPLGAGKVIAGWDEGVQGMKVGGKRRLIIPPQLGYGAQALPGIPANSTLVFDVELLAVQ